jgi:hypothetical protein
MGRHSTLDYAQKQTRTLQEKPPVCYAISIIWVLAACRREPQIQPASFQAGPAIWPASPDMYTRPAGIFTTFIYPRDLSIHRFDARVPTIHSAFLSFQGEKMDWLYLLLILAFFGLSVLLTYGIEKLGRPS